MTSLAKIDANRRNAPKSTGPKTERGKKHSALNALKWGIHAKSLLLPGENPRHYVQLAHALTQDLQPKGAMQDLLTVHIVNSAWRLTRLTSIESQVQRIEMSRRALVCARKLGLEPDQVEPSSGDLCDTVLEGLQPSSPLSALRREFRSEMRTMTDRVQDLRREQRHGRKGAAAIPRDRGSEQHCVDVAHALPDEKTMPPVKHAIAPDTAVCGDESAKVDHEEDARDSVWQNAVPGMMKAHVAHGAGHE